MNKHQLDHVLRAAGRITGQTQFIIIGSQALHGTHPDLPDQIAMSAEVDLVATAALDRTEWLNVIGVGSQFHESFGYYADPVDIHTATLPKRWRERLIDLAPGDTEGVRAQCLEPHDLAIAKYVANREKDRIFTRELARRNITDRNRLLALLKNTAVSKETRQRIEGAIDRDFYERA